LSAASSKYKETRSFFAEDAVVMKSLDAWIIYTRLYLRVDIILRL